jgi:GMP synthase-like glutamine amidotransferase
MGATPISIAILDMYDGVSNLGMRCIHNIIKDWSKTRNKEITVSVFNTRGNGEIPNEHFDIYISSGGPGSPLDTIEEKWDIDFTNWLERIYALKKPVFLICHSFQLACRHFDLGTVCLRKSKQIGILPVHTLIEDDIFNELQETFYALESRSYQIIAPNDKKIRTMGAQILALEKMRPRVPLERAIMAIKFSENMYGVQFHPEADLEELRIYFNEPSTKETVVNEFSMEKWERIMDHLDENSPIINTHKYLMPNFLDKAIAG